MPRCASHDRIDERVAIGLLCLQHQVVARQEAICWTVALLQQQPALVRSDNYILARLALGEEAGLESVQCLWQCCILQRHH